MAKVLRSDTFDEIELSDMTISNTSHETQPVLSTYELKPILLSGILHESIQESHISPLT